MKTRVAATNASTNESSLPLKIENWRGTTRSAIYAQKLPRKSARCLCKARTVAFHYMQAHELTSWSMCSTEWAASIRCSCRGRGANARMQISNQCNHTCGDTEHSIVYLFVGICCSRFFFISRQKIGKINC